MVHVNKSEQQCNYDNKYYNYTDNNHYYNYILVSYWDFIIISIICYHLLMITDDFVKLRMSFFVVFRLL